MAQNRLSPRPPVRKTGRGSQNDPSPAVVLQGALLAFGLVLLLPIFPPLGLLWCGISGWNLYQTLKKEGKVKGDMGRKLNTEFREARDQFIRHVKAEDMMEEKIHPHPHTPVNYSYDKCARDKRLEQIKTLKEAGLLDEAEYKKRRQDILAGK